MSFILNGTQQISLFDSLAFLSERKQHILEKSWAKKFSDYIIYFAKYIFIPAKIQDDTEAIKNRSLSAAVSLLMHLKLHARWYLPACHQHVL